MKAIRIKFKPQPLHHEDKSKIVVRYKDGEDYNPVDPHNPRGEWVHTDRFRSYDLDRKEFCRRQTKEFGEGKLIEENGVFYWERPSHRRLSLKQLAALARRCKTKKEMSFTVRGDQLEECWRIKVIQNRRLSIRNSRYYPAVYGSDDYQTPRKRRPYERRGLKSGAKLNAMVWPAAAMYSDGFKRRLAIQIKEGWQYTWNKIDYVLSLRHSRTVKEIEHGRSASSYVSFYTTLTFDLLQEEAVWIGGMMTIRRKEYAGHDNYPCCWLVRTKNGPGLKFKHGWILNRTFHIVAKSLEQAIRLRDSQIERGLNESLKQSVSSYMPPRGWVNRHKSLMRGNCRSGTDNWIENRLIPFFKQSGATIGDITGIAVRIETVLQIERSSFTTKLE